MTLDADAFTAQMQALLPPGSAWSREPASDLTKCIEGCSPELARVQGRAHDLLREFNPGEAVEMLAEHEAKHGLPSTGTTSQRQAALVAKLRDKAGHNPADYVAWAAARGFSGVQVHRRPLPPFRMGSRCGDRLRSQLWAHAYIVSYMPDVLVPGANDLGAWPIGGGASVTANAAYGPDATLTADRLTLPTATTSYAIADWASATPNAQVSFWLKSESGERRVNFVIDGVTVYTLTVYPYWRRYEMRFSVNTSYGSILKEASGDPALNLLIWGAYVGSVVPAFETAFLVRQQLHAVPIYRVIGDYTKD